MENASQTDQVSHLVHSTNSSVLTRQTQTDFFDSKSLLSVANLSDHPLQQADWIPINNCLREWGLQPIMLTHVSKIQDASDSGYAILDGFQAASLRTTIESLLTENKRRQELVNQLLQSQTVLQKVNDEEQQKSESYKTELLSYRALLETERAKSQELELLHSTGLKSHAEQLHCMEEQNRKLLQRNRELEKENQDMKLLLLRQDGTSKRNLDDEDRELETRPLDNPRHSNKPLDSPSTSGRRTRKKQVAKSRNERLLSEYERKLLIMQSEFHNLRLQMSTNSSSQYPNCSPDDERISSSSMSVEALVSSRQPLRNPFNTSRQTIDKSGTSPTGRPQCIDTNGTSVVSSSTTEVSDASFLFKRLKLTEKKLKEAKRSIKDYEREQKSLSAELAKRPKPKEFAKMVIKCREMEKIIEENNLGLKLSQSPGPLEKTIHGCTHVGNIDFLPIDMCRDHLKDVSSHLGVNNLLDIPERLQEISRMHSLAGKTTQVLRRLDALIRPSDTDSGVEDGSEWAEGRETFLERRGQAILSTVSAWRKELGNLKNVWAAMMTLSEVVRPWRQRRSCEVNKGQDVRQPSTEDLLAYLRELTNECQRGPIKHRRGKPSEAQLLSVVEHFMKLFDVESFPGAFARMNDLYVRYSEMSNVLKTTRELLNLDSNCTLSTVVNAVGRLSKAKKILHVEDLDRIIEDVQKYDTFYSAFKTVMDELLETLGVSQVDEIVPAVQALIRYP